MTKARSNIYLSVEVDRKVDQMAALCIEAFGRRSGRDGGWRSRLIEAAISQFDVAAFIAAETAARERKRAA